MKPKPKPKPKTQEQVGLNQSGIEPALAELTRVYRALFTRFGLPDGTPPVILVQRQGRRKGAAGWCDLGTWREQGGERRFNAITLTAEGLKAGADAAVATLLHEMCHHANGLAGVRDCNPVNQYHMKEFRDRALAAGLTVERAGRGWSRTALGPELADAVAKLNVDKAAFSIFLTVQERKPAPTRMRKWQCGCTVVRCATELQAICLRCEGGKLFVRADAPPVSLNHMVAASGA